MIPFHWCTLLCLSSSFPPIYYYFLAFFCVCLFRENDLLREQLKRHVALVQSHQHQQHSSTAGQENRENKVQISDLQEKLTSVSIEMECTVVQYVIINITLLMSRWLRCMGSWWNSMTDCINRWTEKMPSSLDLDRLLQWPKLRCVYMFIHLPFPPVVLVIICGQWSFSRCQFQLVNCLQKLYNQESSLPFPFLSHTNATFPASIFPFAQAGWSLDPICDQEGPWPRHSPCLPGVCKTGWRWVECVSKVCRIPRVPSSDQCTLAWNSRVQLSTQESNKQWGWRWLYNICSDLFTICSCFALILFPVSTGSGREAAKTSGLSAVRTESLFQANSQEETKQRRV